MFFSAQKICAGYSRNRVVHHVSFSLERGCLMGILGANGSGKTTLVKALCGILPHEGTCLLENTELETLTPKQIAKLVSYIQLKLLEHPTNAMKEAALEALEWVGLGGKEDKNYLHLSEGQKQLCIMARTVVSGSKLLLLDEPESALDFRHRYRMLDMIRSWIHSTQGGAVVTLHDPMLALNYCDNLILLKNGELLDILSPKEDSLEKMEQALSRIYGPVSLQVCRSRSGREILTMLKEDEP